MKGSFLIGDTGQQVLDPEQSEVLRVPLFLGPPEVSSLLYETDLVYTKPRTDVLIHGHAFGPRGKAVASVDVRLKLANIDKTLRVYGDRIVNRGVFGPTVSNPQPFTQMPLMWERSFGGTDQKDANPTRHRWEPRNPVGAGFATQPEHVIGTLAPNIEDPRSPYQGSQRGTPAGFGPIARHWMPRVKLAGTYDTRWEETRSPLSPSDFDERFYQCAPEDQQVDGYLKGGEVVELYNMTPEAYLTFRLPRVTLSMTTRFYDGTEAEHRPVLHTLILQPSKRRFQTVWHSALACHHRVNKLAVTEITLKKRINVSRSESESGVWTGN